MPTEVTFEWQAVTDANRYMLEVFEIDAVTGDLGTTIVSEDDIDQTSYTATLDSGKSYDWRVRARYYDPNDVLYDSESRSSFRTLSTSSN